MTGCNGAAGRITRRSFSMGVLACLAPAVVTAYQSPRRPLPRIGLLVGDDPEGGVAAFTQTLSELGYAEGRNLAIEVRETSGARPVADAARELVRMDPAGRRAFAASRVGGARREPDHADGHRDDAGIRHQRLREDARATLGFSFPRALLSRADRVLP